MWSISIKFFLYAAIISPFILSFTHSVTKYCKVLRNKRVRHFCLSIYAKCLRSLKCFTTIIAFPVCLSTETPFRVDVIQTYKRRHLLQNGRFQLFEYYFEHISFLFKYAESFIFSLVRNLYRGQINSCGQIYINQIRRPPFLLGKNLIYWQFLC